ncbi:MAG TPA: hypothetical protein VG500_06220, partial [Gemmatimonadales bacterium]|nr:hypothetical protein [Gemmatimonadales bacterium]
MPTSPKDTRAYSSAQYATRGTVRTLRARTAGRTNVEGWDLVVSGGQATALLDDHLGDLAAELAADRAGARGRLPR